MADLKTTEMGIPLANPLVMSVCSLSRHVDTIKTLEAVRAGGLVIDCNLGANHDVDSEAQSFFPKPSHGCSLRGARLMRGAIALVAVLGCLGAAAGCSGGSSVGGDAGALCGQTVSALCAQGDPPPGQFGVHCVSTLSAAEKDPAFCAAAPLPDERSCGAYTVIAVTNVDFSYLYAYDASGALVAIGSDGPVLGQLCLAGAATFSFTNPSCASPIPLPACEGADAGASD